MRWIDWLLIRMRMLFRRKRAMELDAELREHPRPADRGECCRWNDA